MKNSPFILTPVLSTKSLLGISLDGVLLRLISGFAVDVVLLGVLGCGSNVKNRVPCLRSIERRGKISFKKKFRRESSVSIPFSSSIKCSFSLLAFTRSGFEKPLHSQVAPASSMYLIAPRSAFGSFIMPFRILDLVMNPLTNF